MIIYIMQDKSEMTINLHCAQRRSFTLLSIFRWITRMTEESESDWCYSMSLRQMFYIINDLDVSRLMMLLWKQDLCSPFAEYQPIRMEHHCPSLCYDGLKRIQKSYIPNVMLDCWRLNVVTMATQAAVALLMTSCLPARNFHSSFHDVCCLYRPNC